MSIGAFGQAQVDEGPGHLHESHQAAETENTRPNSMSIDHHDHAAMGHMTSESSGNPGTRFATDISGLPEAQPARSVILEDGDTFTITAFYVRKQAANHTLRMLAYNQSVPGPFIKVLQDSEILLNFKNDTDIDQTMHSHGLRITNHYDSVPDITQDTVAPGETFEYNLRFKDAGVFWYHPHTREDYGQEPGLYGNYLISPSKVNYWNPVNREVPLVIDDILINDGKIVEFHKEYTNFALLGRFGNEYLVNGETDHSIRVNKGEVIRFLSPMYPVPVATNPVFLVCS